MASSGSGDLTWFVRRRGAALRVRVCGRFSAMLTTLGLTQAERPAGFKGESDVNSGNVLKDDTAPLRTAYILLPLHFYGRAASWFSFIEKARK